ncbi:MAG: Uma2 family endonuclease [Geminicoccaceae bacterium]
MLAGGDRAARRAGGAAVRLDVAEVDGLEHLPHVAGVLSAMRAGLSPHGGHGLRAILHRLLLFHSRDWFRRLQDNSWRNPSPRRMVPKGHGWIVPDAGGWGMSSPRC